MTETEQLQARIAELEGAQLAAQKQAAIAAAMAGHDFASKAAAEQAAALIASDAQVVAGQVVGPGLRPIGQHISEALGKPEFSHFLRPKGVYQPAGAAAPNPAHADWATEIPGENNLSAKAIRVVKARSDADAGPPETTMSKAFGLRPRRGA